MIEPLKLKTADLRGTPVDIYVYPDTGSFSAMHEGQPYGAETLQALWADLLRASRKASARLDIRFEQCAMTSPTIHVGVITGVHARTNNVLVRWDPDGPKRAIEQVTAPFRHGDTFWVRPLTSEERQTWFTVRSAYLVARDAVKEFHDRCAIDPRRVIAEAQGKAAAEASESSKV